MQFHAKERLEDELIEESLSFAWISFLFKSAELTMGSELVDGMKRSENLTLPTRMYPRRSFGLKST